MFDDVLCAFLANTPVARPRRTHAIHNFSGSACVSRIGFSATVYAIELRPIYPDSYLDDRLFEWRNLLLQDEYTLRQFDWEFSEGTSPTGVDTFIRSLVAIGVCHPGVDQTGVECMVTQHRVIYQGKVVMVTQIGLTSLGHEEFNQTVILSGPKDNMAQSRTISRIISAGVAELYFPGGERKHYHYDNLQHTMFRKRSDRRYMPERVGDFEWPISLALNAYKIDLEGTMLGQIIGHVDKHGHVDLPGRTGFQFHYHELDDLLALSRNS